MAATPEIEPDDKALIKATLSGQPDAFGQLVRRHRNALLDVVQRILNSRDEAEDVVQQVFIDSYRHLAEFRHGSQFFTWLYAIALNRSRNQLRQRKIRRQVSLDGMAPGKDKRSLFQLSDKIPTPEVVVERQMTLDWITQELRQLPPHFQVIFTLHYFQQLSIEEVAQRVKRPINTVKVYLHRARKELLAAHEKSSM